MTQGSFNIATSNSDPAIECYSSEKKVKIVGSLPEGYHYGGGELNDTTDQETQHMASTVSRMKNGKIVKGKQRSKSIGTSVSRAITDAVTKLEEMSHESRNKQFHKLFKFIPEDEGLIISYSCALVRDILLQGRLYISENWVCFHSNIFTYETQVFVHMDSIAKVTKNRTAFVVPNAIGIHTESNKHVFGSLLSRHSTYKQLMKIWQRRQNLEETTSQESGSRLDSETEGIEEDEDVPEEEVAAVDVEEEVFSSQAKSSIENRLSTDVLVHEEGQDVGTLHCSSNQNDRSRRKQNLSQITFVHMHTLLQAVLAMSIFKSIRRCITQSVSFSISQPFLAASAFMCFLLTLTSIILFYKVMTFQTQNAEKEVLSHLSHLGSTFVTHHHNNHQRISQMQEDLAHHLQTLIQMQTSVESGELSSDDKS